MLEIVSVFYILNILRGFQTFGQSSQCSLGWYGDEALGHHLTCRCGSTCGVSDLTWTHFRTCPLGRPFILNLIGKYIIFKESGQKGIPEYTTYIYCGTDPSCGSVSLNAVAWERCKTFVLCARFQAWWLLFTVPFWREFRLRTVSTEFQRGV